MPFAVALSFGDRAQPRVGGRGEEQRERQRREDGYHVPGCRREGASHLSVTTLRHRGLHLHFVPPRRRGSCHGPAAWLHRLMADLGPRAPRSSRSITTCSPRARRPRRGSATRAARSARPPARRGRAGDGRGGLRDRAHRRQLARRLRRVQLAARGRARSVVALAPAGGWAEGDESYGRRSTSSPSCRNRWGRSRRVLRSSCVTRGPAAARPSHHRQLRAHPGRAARAPDARRRRVRRRGPMIEFAKREGYSLDAEKIECRCASCGGPRTSCCRGRRRRRASARTGCRTPTGSCSTASGTRPQLDVPLETAQLILGFTQR